MIDEQRLTQHSAEIKELLHVKLGTRGQTLAKHLGHAGRRLPRHVQKAGKVLTDAQGLLGHPTLSKQINMAEVDKSAAHLRYHLGGIDPVDRRKGIMLNLLGSISFILIVVAAAVIGILRWRGFI